MSLGRDRPREIPARPGYLLSRTRGGTLCEVCQSSLRGMDIVISIRENMNKGGDDMALDETLLTGQITPQQIGQAAFQLAPAFPHESPLPFMPRALARRLWPRGFVPFQQPVPTPEVVQPAARPVNQLLAPAAPQPAANQIVRTQAVPHPAPQGYRSINSGGNPIGAISQRRRIVERKGL